MQTKHAGPGRWLVFIPAVFAGCAAEPPAAGLQQAALASTGLAQISLDTQVLAPLAGWNATPAPGQAGALNGADLGWAFTHRDKLWVMFGDSWWIDPVNLVGRPDDALAQISLTDFPDGPSVDAFVSEHPARSGEPAWHAAAPPLQVVQRGGPGSGFAPVINKRDGEEVRSGIGFVPMTGFSNGRDDAGEGVFAIFNSYELVACQDGRCGDGFACDHGLGVAGGDFLTPPCVVGSSLGCDPGPGLCQDQSTSIYDGTDMGRTQSVVLRHDVGITTPDDPVHFKSQPWETQRFFNLTARTVTDFDPGRTDGTHDYQPALGNSLPNAGVFVWGRPHFGGIGVDGRDAQLYLAWVQMPAPDATGHFAWQPQFFSGVDAEGTPQFSTLEVEARPLDLDAAQSGDQPEETNDIVAQMNISWVPSLSRFVMFYGGEGAAMFANAIFAEELAKVRHDPKGSLFVRFAEHPWGPWTAAEPFLAAGHVSSEAEPIDLYAPGGILAHNNCRDRHCAYYDPAYLLDIGNTNNGILYGPSIVDAWTTAHDDMTDLYWFVSTWNPYQVVLMKTTLSLRQ